MRPAIVATAACSALCTVLATGPTTVSPAAAAATPTAATPSPGDADAARALARLRADADKPLRVHGDGSGRVTFVGTRTGDAIDNPSVAPDDDPVTVARHDLDRYGDALGLADGDSGMRTLSRKRALGGDTVVRLQQTVDGLPVLGGQVVVSVDGDGGTSSILSTTSSATRVSSPRVGRADAAVAAVSTTAHAQHRRASTLRATDGSLAVFDPAAFGATSDTGVRTVRQFEVTNGTDVRELVLVDAVTGRVLLHVDDVQTLNRKVCDRANKRGAETACSSGAARSEGGSASGVADVNSAYDLSGEVSTFYHDIGGLDLSELIGFGTAGSRTLGSTVRFCEQDTASGCPYANAFWNGTQMFYGSGYAGADDVVGHEMTHGVISRYSNLFYFFQSGAINESLADIMGEIVDHRFGPDTDDFNSWTMGEDLPGGPIRSMANPASKGQPDKMTSTKYVADLSLYDNGGVHTNSGVGNKTAYLIMHGGTFNGVTVNGIDAGDPTTLTKGAKLYLDVIEKLTSGSDYADLGRQLTQSCSDFVTAGTAGFTSDDCTNVALAVQATELAKQPTVANASTPTDAPVGCPNGQSERVLFDDETAPDPATEFTAGSLWTRAPGSVNGFPADSNATSGQSSWFGLDPDPSLGDAASSPLTLAHAVKVPAGGRTYMRFNHWYAFDYDPTSPRVYYDGGLVKVDNTGDSAGAQQASGLPWINGPTRAVRGSGSTRQTGFGGVSNGFTSSRVDLTSYAGKVVKPQFQVIGDDMFGIEGWYLDDIEIYTCGEELPNKPTGLRTTGGLRSAKVSWTAPAHVGDGISGYRVTGTRGLSRDLPRTARSTTFTGLKASTSYTFKVRALNEERAGGATASTSAIGTRFSGLAVARTGKSETRVTGRLWKVSSSGLGGKTVKVQRKASNGTWFTVARPRTRSGGHLSVTLRGRSTARYRLLFPGGAGLIGGTSGVKHL